MESMSSSRFLREYELNLAKEFEDDGKAAQWAPGVSGPRFWGEEDFSIVLQKDGGTEKNYSSLCASWSPDNRYLAVSVDRTIWIYDAKSRELQAEIVGHESRIEQLHFVPFEQSPSGDSHSAEGAVAREEGVKYLLISEGDQEDSEENNIIVWQIDADGRPIEKSRPFLVQRMADKAIQAISTELDKHRDMNDYEIETIRSGFAATLERAAIQHAKKYLHTASGTLPSFGSYPCSHDGTRWMYAIHGSTTQNEMRPAEELPQLVVQDLRSKDEICRLKGHTDAIMWAGWSKDDKTVVTASWDETFKVFDAVTGECRHTLGPTNGQNWSGSLAPDGKHAVLSGGYPTTVAVYNLATGEKLENSLEFKDWVRELSWNPLGNDVAIVDSQRVILWDPFAGTVETVIQTVDEGTMLSSFACFRDVEWVDGGRKLVVQGSDKTIFVWDREHNYKWRFQRSKGVEVECYEQFVQYLAGDDVIVSVDGDSTVRYWKL